MNKKDVNGIPFNEFKENFSEKIEKIKAEELKKTDVRPYKSKVQPNWDIPHMGPNCMVGNCADISIEGINILLAEMSLLNHKWLDGIFKDTTPGFENKMYWWWTIPMDFSIDKGLVNNES